jgi:hypothetical protein
MTAFCISDPKIVSRPPVTGRDTGGRKVTFWGQKSGIEAILSRPLKGGRDRKSAFLQSKFGVCHDVTTSRLLKFSLGDVGKHTYLPFPIQMVVTVVTVVTGDAMLNNTG